MSLPKPNLILSILMCLLAGIIGSSATFPAIPTWYAELTKPWFTPPGWLFGPAWITLYILMGISLFLVWKKGINKKGVRVALRLFFIQLGLNTLWSILFFGLKSPWLAFIDIVFLWIAIYLTINAFKKISPVAALLLVPYLLWVSFASILNLGVAVLNS